MIEPEEGSDRAHPLPDIAPDHDPAVGGDVAREKQVGVVEIVGEQRSLKHRSDRNAAGAVIGRIDVVFSLRIVELGRAPLDDDVVVALLAVVDARFLDFGTPLRNGRNIPQIEQRQSLAAQAGDRAHHSAIAMGKQHVAVDPCLGVRRQQGGPQFASREHHALVGTVEPVAINVQIMEFVIGADLLQLGVGIRQGQPIPQPDIFDGRLVGLQRLEGESLLGGKRLGRNLIEIVGLPGKRDVAFDVGLLELQLGRSDVEMPEQRRDCAGQRERADADK